MTWSKLFLDDALEIKPRPPRVNKFLKSYKYATSTFGAAVATKAVQNVLTWRERGYEAVSYTHLTLPTKRIV